MKRVIVQILPAEAPSIGVERPASRHTESTPGAGVRVEAVVSEDRANFVVDAVVNPTSASIAEQLVQQELSRDDTGPLFDRVISSVEKALLERVFAECRHIQTRTANRLGVNRNTIHKKLLKHELIQPDVVDDASACLINARD